MASITKEKLGFLLLVVGIFGSIQAAPAPALTKDGLRKYEDLKRDWDDGFLPRTAYPTHYDLEVAPDIYSTSVPPFYFSGSVRIYITCTVETDVIIINALNLDIIGVDVRTDPANPEPPPSPILLQWTLDPDANFLVMIVANPIQVGYKYIISAFYTGQLNNQAAGLNWNSYIDIETQETKYIVAANLQEIGAREVFPCYDEPDLKATYNITILSQSPMKTISNMPVYFTEPRGSYLAYYFSQTPLMSTYQVSVVVGDFAAIPIDTQGLVSYPVTLYVRTQLTSLAGFAAGLVVPIQKWLEDVTGVPYPLPKMDHIAIPAETWETGNWGAITYGETYLLISSRYSGAVGRLRVAKTVAHELAHQWFGNLMSTSFNDVWIREGFAQHYAYRALDAIDWPGREMQLADEYDGTLDFLNFDSLNGSDPVRKPISNVWQADTASEGSTYQKGGALVRQLQSLLTTPTFRTAVTKTLQKYAYGTITTDQLWEEFSAQAALDGRPMDVADVMNAWVTQWGYPRIFVNNNGDGTANAIARQYFSPSGQTASAPSPYNYKWEIPITLLTRTTTDLDAGVTQWIPSEVNGIDHPLHNIPIGASEWYLLNINQSFFYRVDYDTANRNNVNAQLMTDHTIFPSETRCQYIDDAFQMAEALTTPISSAMDTSRYLSRETEYGPWHVGLKHLRNFDRLLQSYSWYPKYQLYLSFLVLPVYERLGWTYDDKENPFQQFLRRDVLVNACYYGLSDCLGTALGLYDSYKADPDAGTVDPNNLPTVLCAGVAKGDSSDTSFVLTQYLNRIESPLREERYAYLFAMSCSVDITWLDRYLYYIVQSQTIADRDKDAAMFYFAQTGYGLHRAKLYFYNGWRNVPSTISKVDRLREITNALTTLGDSNDFNNFVGLHPPQSDEERDNFIQMDRALTQNLDWIETAEFIMEEWLDANLPTSSANIRRSALKLPVSPMAFWNYIEKRR